MDRQGSQLHLVLQEAPQLYDALNHLAQQHRLVFFAGLPGTGKSLFLHQLAHLVHTQGRTVHMLQWDVVRPVFEASAAGQRYPVVQGVTHGVIRQAVGWWARQAVLQWQRQYPAPEHLLLGETPLIGQRLVALAYPMADAAEPVLREACFVIPVPSRPLRLWLEEERQRRALHPRHTQEREDAPPEVMRVLWRQLVEAAVALGLAAEPPRPTAEPAYDPLLYQRVYTHVLRYRQTQVLAVDRQLPTAAFSVYEYHMVRHAVLPTAEEVTQYIAAVERHYPEQQVLQHDIAQWYRHP